MFESVIKDSKLCAPVIFLQSTLNELHIHIFSDNSTLTHKNTLTPTQLTVKRDIET